MFKEELRTWEKCFYNKSKNRLNSSSKRAHFWICHWASMGSDANGEQISLKNCLWSLFVHLVHSETVSVQCTLSSQFQNVVGSQVPLSTQCFKVATTVVEEKRSRNKERTKCQLWSNFDWVHDNNKVDSDNDRDHHQNAHQNSFSKVPHALSQLKNSRRFHTGEM